MCGLLFGAASGIIRGAPPVLFSLMTGTMWAISASVFWRMYTIAHTNYLSSPASEL